MVTPNADGPDISHWNTISSWSLVPSYSFWSLKATEGRRYVDPTFRSRRDRLRAMGVRYRGAFHWIRSDSPIKDQVAHFLQTVGPLEQGEFLQTDWERTYVNQSVIRDVTATEVEEFNDRIRQTLGFNPVITYSSDWVPHFVEWRNENPNDPLWYANYNTGNRDRDGWAECDKYRADVWQWTSTAKVPGFTGGIDMNHVFDWSTLDHICRYDNSRPPTFPQVPPFTGERHVSQFIPTDGPRIYGPKVMQAGQVHSVPMPAGVPDDVEAVTVSITAVGINAGHLTVWSGNGNAPEISHVNFAPDSVDNGNVTVGVKDKSFKAVIGAGSAKIMLDLNGYFLPQDPIPGPEGPSGWDELVERICN